MNDPTPQGRRIQALHAAQIPFSGAMDDVLAILNPDGDLPRRLGANARWYADPTRDSFAWLDSPDSAHRALADDVVDAARLVRAADALRQRGTTLRTTAGYEIFIDAQTGQAVYSLRTSVGDRLFLLRVDNPVGAGEANLRKAELTRTATWVSFHRGRFSSPAAAAAAAGEATARVVADIGDDVLGAFEVRRPSADLPAPGARPGLDAGRARASGGRAGVRGGGDCGSRPYRSSCSSRGSSGRRSRERVAGEASAVPPGDRDLRRKRGSWRDPRRARRPRHAGRRNRPSQGVRRRAAGRRVQRFRLS
jgi:hypothetical protein